MQPESSTTDQAVRVTTDNAETIENLEIQIKKTVKDRFPDSYLNIMKSTLGGDTRPSICIKFALGKDKTEWPNGIIHNDRAHNQIWVNCNVINSITKNISTDEIKITALTGSIIGLQDKKTCKMDKLGWRDIKKPTNIQGVIKALTKYFDKMKEAELGINKSQGISI